jgi:hypothetical protein
MKKLILMVGLIVVGIACGDAVGEMLDVPDAGAQPGDGSSMQYVGNSTKTFQGDATVSVDGETVPQGIYTHYAACQEAFGPGHRTCTANEITFTTKIPQLSEGYAWYEPRGGCAPYSSNNSTLYRNAVDERGAFSRQRCGNTYELPIACCGPK